MSGKHRREECEFCKKPIGYRLDKYASLLRKLSSTSSAKIRKNLIRKADPCFIEILRECALNVLRKNLPVPADRLRKLKRHAKAMVYVAKPRKSVRRTQRALEQKGGFLPLILPAVVSLLSGFAGEALGKAIHRNG